MLPAPRQDTLESSPDDVDSGSANACSQTPRAADIGQMAYPGNDGSDWDRGGKVTDTSGADIKDQMDGRYGAAAAPAIKSTVEGVAAVAAVRKNRMATVGCVFELT